MGKANSKRRKAVRPVKTNEVALEEIRKRDLRSWMDALARVHVEAEPLFKKTREKLNAMNLERTAPKKRAKVAKSVPDSELIDNPHTDGLGGMAGKSHFLIRVSGEVENLYKTTKPSKNVSGSKQHVELDLHGFTKDEALSKLDECLPQWVDAAYKGKYPWVMTVMIVCGKGSQILSEAVENWIKQNKKVANAPKSIY